MKNSLSVSLNSYTRNYLILFCFCFSLLLIQNLKQVEAKPLQLMVSLTYAPDIVLCCGSNKSIQVFDMNAARTVRVILDSHTRPAHTICQNEVGCSENVCSPSQFKPQIVKIGSSSLLGLESAL